MRWLLDSNVLIDALAGLPHGVRVLREARKRPEVLVIYSAISRIEVLGFPNLSEQEEAAATRNKTRILFIVKRFLGCRQARRSLGRPMPFADLPKSAIPDLR